MKTYNIFKKNLKTVSRNWVYFVVLFICPLVLIFVAGLVLNSNDFQNMKIGVIDDDSGYDFNLENVRNVQTYSSLENCLYELTNSLTNICLYVRNAEEVHQIDIYIDNTKSIIEYYTKQFILQNVFKEQSEIFQKTSEEIDAKLTVYSTSIANAKVELTEVKKELEIQEKLLTDYRRNLTIIREDFNEVYIPLKNMQPEIKEIQANFHRNSQDLNNNISRFRNKKQDIESNINNLRNFLLTRLNPTDYNYSSLILDTVLADINETDRILTNIENSQPNSELMGVIDNLDTAITKMDSINQTLYQIDSDLELSIKQTQNSRTRIDYFIGKLNEATKDMDEFSKGMDSKKILLEFKNAFSISEDPVFNAFPLLITIIITFTSLVLSNIFILKQINRASYFREIIAPASDFSFLLADYLINLFFIFVQSMVLFLIGFLWFNIPLESIYVFIFSIFLTASIFIFIGIGIGYLIKSQSLSMLITIFFL